jgi:MFS family permease
VVALFLIAAFLRLSRLKETVVSAEKPSLSELLRTYPISLKESFIVWKRVPKSMLYLFLSSSIATFGIATVQLFFLVYAVKVIMIDEAVWPMILTALFVTMIVLAVPMGKIADKTNRKVPILVAYLLFGSAMWLFVNGDLIKIFLSLMLVGVGQTMMNASFGALQADLTPKEERGKINGFTNFVSCILMALGSFIGGVMYERLSPQLPFYVATALVIPAFVLTMFLVTEPEKREE